MNASARILATALVLSAASVGVEVHSASAQHPAENRTVLLTNDLKGVDGQEVRMWRTDIPPGVVGAKHYHPGTECIYVLEGALDLEKVGETTVHLNTGEAHCVPPQTVLIPRNASNTAPYKSLVVMIAPKGQPLAVPVK